MADPVVSTLVSGSSSTATTTASFTAQTAGTLLLLQVQSDDYRTTSGAGRPESTGWTLATSGQDFLGHYLWYKIASGSETSVQYTIGSGSASSYQVLAATNIDPTPLGATSSLHTHGGANTGTTAITPASGSRWLVIASFGGMHSSASSLGPAAAVSNSYTIRSSVTGSGSPTEVGTVAYLVLDGGTATSSATVSPGWTVNSPSCSYGLLAAFKVAAGGGGAVTSSPTGIASALVFGAVAVALALTVGPTGIATSAAFGTPAVSTTLTSSPAGIASGGAFGTPAVSASLTVSPGGISSSEAFGSPVVTAGYVASPTGIPSSLVFGTPAVSMSLTSSPTGIPSGEAFGAPSVVTVGIASPTGIPSAEAFGVPSVTTLLTTSPAGIVSAAAFGAPVVSMVLTAGPAGIGSSEAVGDPTVILTLVTGPVGIPTGEAFGTPAAIDTTGVVDITVTASIDPRRWTAILPGRAISATIDSRRWEGHIMSKLNDYPRETDEAQPITVRVNGVVVTDDVSFVLTTGETRPASGWVDAVMLGGKTCVTVAGLTPGVYGVWAKVDSPPEHPVFKCGEILIT